MYTDCSGSLRKVLTYCTLMTVHEAVIPVTVLLNSSNKVPTYTECTDSSDCRSLQILKSLY